MSRILVLQSLYTLVCFDMNIESTAPFLIQLLFRLFRLSQDDAQLLLSECKRHSASSDGVKVSNEIGSSKYLSLCWVLLAMIKERPIYFILGVASIVLLPVSVIVLIFFGK